MSGAAERDRAWVDAVIEAIARSGSWRSHGWVETPGVSADEPESFHLGDRSLGIRCVVDPTLPPDRIEIRDSVTGEVRAYWGEHGVFEVLPPRWPTGGSGA